MKQLDQLKTIKLFNNRQYRRQAYIFFLIICFLGAGTQPSKANDAASTSSVELLVLGVAQDAGYPQINCYRPHCMPGWQDPSLRRLATSLALVDHKNRQKYIFEATPDIKEQFYRLHQMAPDKHYPLSGIFLTHAHMGHYTGLMHLGREAAGSEAVPVYAMPKMNQYLTNNGPWSQLVKLNNIQLRQLTNNQQTKLAAKLSVTPFTVPHRDEFSETVGYRIDGPNKSALFIPDIDKWQKWKLDIREQIKLVDYAFLDATFFANDELPNRDMSEVPHPFVEESMALFSSLLPAEKEKVIFIHFNHSNPLMQDASEAQRQVTENGFRFAVEGMRIAL